MRRQYDQNDMATACPNCQDVYSLWIWILHKISMHYFSGCHMRPIQLMQFLAIPSGSAHCDVRCHMCQSDNLLVKPIEWSTASVSGGCSHRNVEPCLPGDYLLHQLAVPIPAPNSHLQPHFAHRFHSARQINSSSLPPPQRVTVLASSILPVFLEFSTRALRQHRRPTGAVH